MKPKLTNVIDTHHTAYGTIKRAPMKPKTIDDILTELAKYRGGQTSKPFISQAKAQIKELLKGEMRKLIDTRIGRTDYDRGFIDGVNKAIFEVNQIMEEVFE